MGIHRSFIKFWLHLIKNRSSHQKRSIKKAFLKPLSKIRCFLRVLWNFKKHFFYRAPPDDSFWKKYLIKTFFCCVSIVKRLLTIFVPVLIHWESCFHFCNTSKKNHEYPWENFIMLFEVLLADAKNVLNHLYIKFIYHEHDHELVWVEQLYLKILMFTV